MNWMKWVEKELRSYLCHEVDLEYYQNKINELDNDIWLRTSHLDGMPRANRVSSIVERQLIRKEKSKEYWENKIKRLKRRTSCTKKALNRLPDEYRVLLKKNYFGVAFSDREIAEELGYSLKRFEHMKEYALSLLFNELTVRYKVAK
jgi:ArpU family phage transcriptional regulator